MFVDKSRSIAVVMGEKDNKKAIDTMKKALIKKKMKYGAAGDEYEEAAQLKWEEYYAKVQGQKGSNITICIYVGKLLPETEKLYPRGEGGQSGYRGAHERQD